MGDLAFQNLPIEELGDAGREAVFLVLAAVRIGCAAMASRRALVIVIDRIVAEGDEFQGRFVPCVPEQVELFTVDDGDGGAIGKLHGGTPGTFGRDRAASWAGKSCVTKRIGCRCRGQERPVRQSSRTS